MLDRYGIPHLYEHPVAVVDDGKTRIWYPDFQLGGYGILVEYCGKPDDPAYSEGMTRKQAVYAANGLTALMFTPDLFQGDWPTRMLDQIEGVLSDRLGSFRECRNQHFSMDGCGAAYPLGSSVGHLQDRSGGDV